MSPDPVLVTGCSTGIGRATALRLARHGHVVYASARRPGTLADLETAGCRTLALDVTDEASMRAAVAAIAAEHASVEQATRDAYERGPLKLLGGGPDAVAKAIEKALTTPDPRARYRVTPSARLLLRARALATDGMWDRFMATQFRRPAG